MLVAFDIVEHEDLPRAVRQLRERRLEIHGHISWSHRRGHRVEDAVALFEPLAPQRLRSETFDDDIDGEPMEPGGEGRVAAERAELLPDANEYVLRHLIGVPTARHPPHQ